ncbi:MAG: hypothetical protein IEMM0002_0599 [bacterium]|nr:MAG: hypothetical protein IEMM0002_0599 [bacterium]
MTDFLFAQPSLLEGVARIFDIGCLYDAYNKSPAPDEADQTAIYNDWKAVGDDIRGAIRNYATENQLVGE